MQAFRFLCKHNDMAFRIVSKYFNIFAADKNVMLEISSLI